MLEKDGVKGQISICLKEGIYAKSLLDLLKIIKHSLKQYNPCSKNTFGGKEREGKVSNYHLLIQSLGAFLSG